MSFDIKQITDQIVSTYELEDAVCKDLGTPTNDVIQVTARNKRFALKLYTVTTPAEIQWEIDLLLHLLSRNVPVVRPIKAKDGYLNRFVDGEERIGVLFEWAVGEKPKDERDTYILIGKAAAQIHQASDSFVSTLPHTKYNVSLLIDEQLERMRPLLIESGQLQRVVDLTARLRNIINNPALDYGVCHMDLKPDNVHVNGNEKITVFDFNSSGESWRAIEPYRILKLSEDYFKAWLKGYRLVRSFSEADEKAVAAFGIIGAIRSIVWDLGLAISSRGKPLLQASDLPKIVDDWLKWEQDKITN